MDKRLIGILRVTIVAIVFIVSYGFSQSNQTDNTADSPSPSVAPPAALSDTSTSDAEPSF